MLRFHNDKPVLVVGDVMLDRTFDCEVLRIAPEAPSPVVRIRRTDLSPGGAANVAINLFELGMNVRLVGLAGKDPEAGHLLDAISMRCRPGKRLRADIVPSERRRTIVKTRFVSDNHQFLRVDREEPFTETDREIHQVLHEHGVVISGCAAVVLSDYGKGTISHASARAIIQEAGSLGVPVFADPKGSVNMYRDVYLLKPNEEEYVTFCQPDAADSVRVRPLSLALTGELTRRCHDHHLDHIVVTLGSRGMLWARRDGAGGHVPGIPTAVHNVSGAGDVAMAVLVAAHLADGADSPEWPAQIATLASGLAVARSGTSVVTWFELNHAWGQKHHAAKILRRGEGEAAAAAYWETIERYGREARRLGKRLVFTNGCFDIMHDGHSWLLGQARREGDLVFVGVNSDESVRALKGGNRPINGLDQRMTFLASLANVDAVASFNSEEELEKLIRTLNPHVLVKGGEWRNKAIRGADWVCAHGGRVVFVAAASPTHTSLLLEKLGK